MKFDNYMILEFPSKSCNEAFARSAIACFAAQMDPTLEELGDIRTAVSEAVTNCIVHAYPQRIGIITLRCRILKDNVLDIVIKDKGVGIQDVELHHRRSRAQRHGLYHYGEFYDYPEHRLCRREGDYGTYAPEAAAPPMRDPEELIAQIQSGDQAAAESLVEENAGLIWAVARRFQGRGTELEDLYQLGCLGFLKAVEGYDPAFGTRFSTYAVPKIAGEIRRFLRDDGAVKVSRGLKEQSAAVKAARSRLTGTLGREPSLQELSRETGMTVEEIALAETATAATESINRETGEDGFTLESVLTDTEEEERMVEKIALKQAVSCLPDREKQVIGLRYFHGLTQQKTAAILGISQVQVSRIERKALGMLKEKLDG